MFDTPILKYSDVAGSSSSQIRASYTEGGKTKTLTKICTDDLVRYTITVHDSIVNYTSNVTLYDLTLAVNHYNSINLC